MATTPHSSVGVLTVLGGRLSMDNRMGGVSSVKMFDERNGVFRHSGQFRCMAGGSHNVKQYHSSKDSFLNLHPEVSMLRGSWNGRRNCTGGAPIIVGVAKAMGILMLVLSQPVIFEGREGQFKPRKVFAALRENVDTLIVIPNDKLLTASFDLPHESMLLTWSMIYADKVSVVPGLVNVYFADVRAIMANAGSFAEKV
ncbi:hypothetical protein IFM89_022351 [Coptis chinensis]|uniref:Tubulin/FtsZ GTPase domain-containing protein n=1 Tax=Coptis chinensis TaxID=261450 RepID=A0A835GYK4_9MAGN|nr:hypothetical protein IFM89_022351 [Coptis chinensis]